MFLHSSAKNRIITWWNAKRVTIFSLDMNDKRKTQLHNVKYNSMQERTWAHTTKVFTVFNYFNGLRFHFSFFFSFFHFFHFPVQSNCIILEITCFLDSLFKESIVVLISSWHTLKECRTFSVAPETIILRLDFNCPVCDDWTRRKTSLYRFEKPSSFYCIFKVSQLLYLLPVFIE